MGKRGLGILLAALCAAMGLAVIFSPRHPAAASGPDEPAERALRDRQRANAAAEVKRIVAAENPSAAAGSDSPDLEQARARRLDEMAEAVRLAVPTPEPEIRKAP